MFKNPSSLMMWLLLYKQVGPLETQKEFIIYGTLFLRAPGQIFKSKLPPWHAYERACDYLILSLGIEQVYTNENYLKDDLRHYQPKYMISVLLVFESLYRS